MKYLHVFTFLALLIFGTACNGQNQTVSPQDNFSKEHNGLSKAQLKELATSKVPKGQVRNIIQDRNGNIVIAATWSGVYQYDGKSFTNLTHGKIESHRFWDVLEDRKGNFWFASTDSGVYYYTGKTFKHFTTREGLADNRVMSIFEDKTGNIWFGTGGGISRYNGKSFQNFTTKDGLSSNDLTTIIEDKIGRIWIGTRGEAFVYDGKTFTRLIHEGNPFNNVWSIIEDKKGNIWLGGNGGSANGLWRYDPSADFNSAQPTSLRASGNVFTRVSQRGVYAIIEDKKGNIWTTGAINPNGQVWALSRYDQKSLYDKKPNVTEIISGPPALLGLMEASDGSIWFGSAGGVHRYDGKTITDF